MSTSRHKHKSGDHNDASWHESLEGTSARTRPISFEDIMRRRKRREGAAKHLEDKPETSDIALDEGNLLKTPHSMGRDRKNIDENRTRSSTAKDRESIDDSVPANSRRTSRDAQKLSSRTKRDASPSKNGKSIHDRDKRLWNSEDSLKVTTDSNLMRNRLSSDKNERHHHTPNKDGVHSNDVDDRSDTKQSRDLVEKDKAPERPRVGSENPEGSSKVTADKTVRSDQSSPGKRERHHQKINKYHIHGNDTNDRSDMRQNSDLVEKEKVPERSRVRSEKPENSSKDMADKNVRGDRASSGKIDGHHQGANKDDIPNSDIDDMRQGGDLVERDKIPMSPRARSEKPDNSSKVIADKNVRSDRSSSGKRKRHQQGTNKDDTHSNDIDDRDDARQGGELVEKDKVLERSRVRSENPEDSSTAIADKNVRNNRSSSVKGGRPRHHHGTNKDDIHSNDVDHKSDLRHIKDLIRNDYVPERPRVKSEIVREQLDDGDRHLHKKRKTVDRMSSIPEDGEGPKKRNARDVMQADKLHERHKDKSETENRRKHEGDKTRGRSTGKEHDSEKQGLGEKHAHLNQPRSKRKRSRSTERERGRRRKSRSHSPKEHKHATKHRRDKGELLSQSTKDRTTMDRSDVDKKRTSSNGSSHYWRNSGSASGLGGYSPRKRRSDTAAKTPSPTRRSPEKKQAGWNLSTVGKDSITASSIVNDLHTNQDKSAEIKDFPFGTSLTQPVLNPVGNFHHALPLKVHAIESIQLTQATRPLRRLYAENLPGLASEKDLMECINKLLLSSGVNYVQGTQPCISCIMHKEKGQALLEFLTPEDASAALSFDGISFSGSNLKLRRPRDYTDVTTGLDVKSVVAVSTVSDIVEDSPHKIFIGGISKLISSRMLLDIARGFGPVRAYHFVLAADSNYQSAFLEYVDHSVSPKACAGLNGMSLGGKVITAVFATPNAVQANAGRPPLYGIPDHAKSLLETPTAVLTMKNVLDPVGLSALSDSELEEILEDIRLECSRFGTVKAINVAKPNDNARTTEAHKTKDVEPYIDACDSELDDKRHATERLGDSVNELREDNLDTSETLTQSENKEAGEVNKGDDSSVDIPTLDPVDLATSVFVGDSVSDNLPKDEVIEPLPDGNNNSPESPSSQLDSGLVAGESTIQQSASTNELLSNVNDAESSPMRNIEMENKPSTDGEMKLKESNAETVNTAESDFNERMGASEDSDKKDTLDTLTESGDVFEPGTVFVEYRRAESACIAAHSLHGRIFDGRVVAVAYASLDLYHMKFPR